MIVIVSATVIGQTRNSTRESLRVLLLSIFCPKIPRTRVFVLSSESAPVGVTIAALIPPSDVPWLTLSSNGPCTTTQYSFLINTVPDWAAFDNLFKLFLSADWSTQLVGSTGDRSLVRVLSGTPRCVAPRRYDQYLMDYYLSQSKTEFSFGQRWKRSYVTMTTFGRW